MLNSFNGFLNATYVWCCQSRVLFLSCALDLKRTVIMKCRITKQGSNCAVLVSGTPHIAESFKRESKFSPIFSPKSSAIAFTPNPILPPCMGAMNSVSPALKPKHHLITTASSNAPCARAVAQRPYLGVQAQSAIKCPCGFS